MDKEKYEQALERAKEYYEAYEGKEMMAHARGALEYIFPELKMSDDEKIRKHLISLFKKFVTLGVANECETSEIKVDDILFWLEKQAQKPTDKFKVGDWVFIEQIDNIINGPRKIKEVNDYGYILDGIRETTLPFTSKHCMRLWAIQDAKDGDVVVDKSDGTVGIFQSIGHHPDGGSYNDLSYCFLHCRYDDGFFYADFEDGNTIDSDDVIPATKEQRDLLFAKMKEAGYMWDAKKKELKKIEQNTVVVIPKFRVGDVIRPKGSTAEYTIESISGECYHGKGWGLHISCDDDYELVEQNPAWSEEDENFLKTALWHISYSISNGKSTDFHCDTTDWLKNLKDRVQPRNTWKPSDEQLGVLNTINVTGCITEVGQGKSLVELYKQLMKLREE